MEGFATDDYYVGRMLGSHFLFYHIVMYCHVLQAYLRWPQSRLISIGSFKTRGEDWTLASSGPPRSAYKYNIKY